VATTLKYVKQKNYESLEDYYDRFLWLYVAILQQSHDIYFIESFRKRLRTNVKMAILSMLWRTLVEVAKSTIMIEK
jgi:hypothetical protein